MTANANELSVEALIIRQDRQSERQEMQFAEVRKDLKEVAQFTKENALAMKDLTVVLTESSVESRHVRMDQAKLELRFEEYVRTNDIKVDAVDNKVSAKLSNQKLIIVIGAAILSSIFSVIGWLIGKS